MLKCFVLLTALRRLLVNKIDGILIKQPKPGVLSQIFHVEGLVEVQNSIPTKLITVATMKT